MTPSRRGLVASLPERPKAILVVSSDLKELLALCDLAADPLAIAAQLAEDPVMGPLVAARPGLRVPGAWDGFKLAVCAILGQQITVAAARRALRNRRLALA